MHRLWINDRRNACQRVYDDMCLRATDKPSDTYFAFLPRTAGRCKNRIDTLILISRHSKQGKNRIPIRLLSLERSTPCVLNV